MARDPEATTVRERAGDPVVVKFTVNELLARIDAKIDTLTAVIHTKADRAEIERLESRVNELEKSGSHSARQALREVKELDMKTSTLEKAMTLMDPTLENRVLQLEKESVSSKAMEETEKEIKGHTEKLRWMAISNIIAAVAAGAAIIFGLLAYIKH